jgi:hypothetical protein
MVKKAIWLLVILLVMGALVTACGAGTKETASPSGMPTVPATVTPLPPTPAPLVPTREPPEAKPGDSPCGDGVCEGPENAQNCPEDCAGEAVESPETAPPAATSGPDYEPPINVFLVLHIDPAVDRDSNTFKVEAGFYQRTRDEIYWLMEGAERHGLHFTSLYNGWYTKWALEHGDTAQFRELIDAGHEIGSHAHRITYDADMDLWISWVDELNRYGRPNYDAALARQCWEDADTYMDQVIAEIGAPEQNQIMCAVPFLCSDEGQLMGDLGFTIAPGNRSEKGTSYFGHIVWNPWRPAASDEPAHELQEDLTASYVALDHLAQIGRSESHGMDVTVPQMQRRFLMLYAEWLARERSGADDKVWSFGFVVHPNYGDQYNADLVEFLSWLDEHFIGKTSAHGNVISRYASVGEIATEYEAWEDENPEVSSFSYVPDDPYPYTYELMPIMLDGAAYEGDVDLGVGITAFELSKEGQPIYLLWSDLGERTVDFSSELAGQVRVTRASGVAGTQDAAALDVTEEPVFVEPL